MPGVDQQAWDIRLENLKVGYDDLVVLDGINATLPGGKISVILGGSGCGKSTLLRHILGLRRPMGGRIYLGDHNLFQLPRSQFRKLRRRMGVLFQDGALLGSLPLEENVALPLKEHTNLAPVTIQDIVQLRLELVGLEQFGAYYPNQLSGGMRKRAGLARAIVADPPVLFCDEPTSGLDPINAAQMDQLLLDLKKAFPYMTMVVVSHDLDSMMQIADYVMVLFEGSAVFQGTVEELENTRDPYLRQFLDRVPDERALPDMTVQHELIKQAFHTLR